MLSSIVWPREDEARALLAQLIAIPSVNPLYAADCSEERLVFFITDYMRTLDIPTKLEYFAPNRPNGLGYVAGSVGKKTLLWDAHTDTVQAEGMKGDPFRAEYKDGCIYGRGACDDKASIAAMLLALRTLRTNGLVPRSNLLLSFSGDEEGGFRGVKHLVAGGIKADAAIVGEPTKLEVVIAHKASLRWQLVVEGKAAHSSQVHKGVNAIFHMSRVVQHIEEQLIPLCSSKVHPQVGSPTLCVTMIRGGEGRNTVPARCVIDIDRRLIPGEEPDQVLADFAQTLTTLEDVSFTMEKPYHVDLPMETSKDAPIVKCMKESFLACGITPKLAGADFGTNASKFTGVPGVVFGPGSIEYAHSADEHVEVAQVLKAAQILTMAALKFE
ncbi:MAG: M20 family metallopeptidase [Limnochordia bacterium]|nr:M20 family metallopeptidase [Limnochordia bacterium]MDD4518204.1 M20 family metallopeptidase [Limnochordia bacterium]